MNKFTQQLSVLLGLSVFTTVSGGLSVQAQTIVPESMEGLEKGSLNTAKPLPVPGTTPTSSAAFAQPASLAPRSPKVAEVTSPRVAQADVYTQPSPGVDTPPTPDSPTVPATPTAPTTAVSFPDVDPNYWAYPFIQNLAANNIISGFPDSTFRPEEPVERAEFAAMIQKAFEQNRVRQLSPGGFTDVPPDYWATAAIQEAYESGFMEGYPGNLFQPAQEIPKVQAITSLASGLALTPTGSAVDLLNTYYTDAGQIPPYAIEPVAAATQANAVVNYPNVNTLNPLQPLTRAEAAAHIHQALVRLGQLQPIPSNFAAASYIVGPPAAAAQTPPPTPETPPTTPAETAPAETAQTPDIEPGQATRGGSSYLAVGANIGAVGDSALGDDVSFTVLSKIGLLNFLSVRPAVVVDDDPTILLPITYDLNTRSAGAFGEGFSISPYAGLGIGISTADDSEVGFLLTGGIDVPLSERLTATANASAILADDTQLGVIIGIGYNFTGF